MSSSIDRPTTETLGLEVHVSANWSRILKLMH